MFINNRPARIANDMLTWVRGKHTFEFGGEFRALGVNNAEPYNESGTFNFYDLNTGLIGTVSGNSTASFLMEQVGNANVNFYTVVPQYSRSKYVVAFFGDTWKATPKLSVNYGLRWDLSTPHSEKYDNLSFFDPNGVNPEAGNRLGSLAFAGTKWGAASFGRSTPELTWYGGFAPRLGLAYTLTPKTVVRTGYGIFYQQAPYPGWNGGIPLTGVVGFNANPSFSSSLGGMDAAFTLSQGFPQNFAHPPIISPGAVNGQGSILYRPFDANRLPNAQQWNLTAEHQLTNNAYISAAYVGNKGTRLVSRTAPLNAIDPQYLSMGEQLYDQFQPGQTSLDGVSIPYAGWVEQMTGCPPTVAQALLPYPQFCSDLYGLNENAGNSTYHSFQLKAENRFSHGVWILGSYTSSKLLTDSDSMQADDMAVVGYISPFERKRNKALSVDDVPQALSVALVYQLPFGKGQRFVSRAGALDKLVGGWQVSTSLRVQSGVPFQFTSSTCNVPGQFAVGCLPGILPGANPWAQSKSQFSPDEPLFNAGAFESPSSFNFYSGQGPRVSNLRGFGYRDGDFGLMKNLKFSERVSLQLRGEFFNILNEHAFICQTECFGGTAFGTDVSSPSFGMWNGSVTAPRNIQVAAKIIF
jgi:hypothetical protein